MKYVLEVQLTPKMHDGHMQYYWHIDQINEDGRFTVEHGYSTNFANALVDAHIKSLNLV